MQGEKARVIYDLKLVSYNVKDLNSPTKRHKILKELQQYGADIVFLQETHLVLDTRIRLFSTELPCWFYSDSPIRRSKGVAIGFSRASNFTLVDRMTDPDGWYIFLKGKIGNKVMTLANIYCPNKNPTVFLGQVLTRLMRFREGEVVLAGDLNFCLDPSLDSTSRAQGIRKVSRSSIGKQLSGCRLMDAWRLQHAKDRDYTFFSPVHGTYSRLDYIFVDHCLPEWVEETRIEIMSLSDHSLVTMRLRLPIREERPFSWKLNSPC